MSSRRKSSVPCMVRYEPDLPEEQQDHEKATYLEPPAEKEQPYTSETAEQENPDQQNPDPEPPEPEVGLEGEPGGDKVASEQRDLEGEEEEEVGSQRKQSRAYECKYCPFSTKNLKDFKEHVDSSHPNVILNPLYLCAACSFNTNKFDSLTEHNESQHPGQTNFKFKRIKVNNQTVLEQTIEGKDTSADGQKGYGGDGGQSPALPAFVSTAVKTPESLTPLYLASDFGGPLGGHKDQITALNINGTVIIPEPSVLRGLSHVAPMLQRPPNFQSVPKIAVPLNTTKYNPSLDDNLTLMASFNKFPYPTHAELSWLTAASRHPEEQIKVWFTTQRLKQGITWSPEEVEEARKKMFNGSIPATHHTFAVLPTSSSSQALAKPLLQTAVRHHNHVRVSVPNGLSAAAMANAPGGIVLAPKRPHVTSVFGPESKRPIMAVAPHPGSSIDKVLMAPPPPPQKDRFLMAPPPAPVEMKRPVAVPLVSSEVKRSSTTVPLMPPLPPSLASPSLAPKGKIPAAGGQKTKPLVSLPSIVFPESLTRPTIAPPPIFAPSFKTSSLIPFTQSIVSKEKHPAAGTDLKLPASSQLVTPQIRRPPIIQSIRAPLKLPTPIPAFPMDGKKPKEQQGVAEQKAEVNGTSRADGKWPLDQSHLVHNNGVAHLDATGGSAEALAATKLDLQHKSSVLTQFPLLERMKGKTAEQLKVLEENFLRNSFPTQGEVDGLAGTTRLSHQEINSWFVERRALRDNLEQALLNSMGSKRMGPVGKKALLHHHHHHHHQQQQQQQQQQQTLQLNGIHKPRGGPHGLPILTPGAMAPPLANPTPCSVPVDGRSLALLKDDFAQMRWPSPEELGQLEAPTGPARADLARWFGDARLHTGAIEFTELFQGNGVNGLQGLPLSSMDKAPPSIVRQCQEGAFTNNGNNSKVLEVEFGWLMEQRGGNQQDKLLAGRLGQQEAELKNGGMVGGARDVLGSWLQDGRQLLLERDRKLAEDAAGRLTG
ncbi:zinc fingers and homeoboxes protein 2-like [Nelusetta ayraudi]|uniref:zinc fingers and homeoboxes protein 2-like n=1 Tax=Nelusetta ayraudi TaxID=303726 RepID=UPI003F71D88E